MDDFLKKTIDGLPADYADIRVERVMSTALLYMGPVLEEIGTTFTFGGCIRVCVKGGWGFASFNSLEEARRNALTACDMARLTARDGMILAPVEPVKVHIRDEATRPPATVSLDEKHDVVRRYNAILLEGKGIVTSTVAYRDSTVDYWFHSSDGTIIHHKKSRAGVSFSAAAKDGANVQRGRKSFGDTRGFDTVLNREGDVENVVKITRDLITAPKVSSGLYTVVLDPQLAGVFAHEAFGHLSEADFVYENPKALGMMKLGRRFGTELLNIADEGPLSGENGFTPFDDEGVKGGKTYLIRNGVLVGRLHSRETAGRMGEKPTGNARALSILHRPIVRMTTTYIEAGETSFDEMIAGIDRGIYSCGFLGGNTDLERFTFSSAYAYIIEKGKITTPLRDVILSGNVFETMHNITMVGNERTLFGGLGGCGKGAQSPLPVSDGSPHLCIKNVLVG